VIFYKSKRFEIFPQVYMPSDDSFLLVDSLTVKEGDEVLDLGTGCGIQGIFAAEKASKVLACDINPNAVECARYNVKLNKADNMTVIHSNLFQMVRGRFNLIIFNPPYLPSHPSDLDDYLRKSWDGGREGRAIIDRFIHEVMDFLAKDGKVQIVQSSLNNVEKTVQRFKEVGLHPEITAEKKHFFEKLYVVNVYND
jgi:release factor glutamine methyltransferase